MAVWDVYAEQLYKFNRGLPVWEADPGWGRKTGRRLPAVEVGDVGYMSRGRFICLFNIHLEPDDPRQPEQMPEYFEPLRIEDEDRDITLSKLKTLIFTSKTVRSVDVALGGGV